MDCRAVLAQTNPRLGDVQTNLQDHLERVEAARSEGFDLIVFPELSLTGYFLKDQVHELGMELDAEPLARLVERSKEISIAVGFVERSRDGRLYNSLAFLEQGQILGIHRKVHLVAYGIFDEARDFAAGESFEIIESRLGRFGPLICEDVWHVPSSYVHFLNDADAFLIASSPPLRGVEAGAKGLASQRTWTTLLTACSLFYRTWVAYASRVGWEDGIGFGGGSCVIDPFGDRQAYLAGPETGSVQATLDRDALLRARVTTPLRRDEKPWILATELAHHVPLLERLEPRDCAES